jgi:hypothetical protein
MVVVVVVQKADASTSAAAGWAAWYRRWTQSWVGAGALPQDRGCV